MKLFKFMSLLSVFVLTTVMVAQTKIPIGTVIPVRLNSALDAKKCKPGQTIMARVAQDVPLENGAKIKAGTRVVGEVLTVTAAGNSGPSSIALRFDKIDISGRVTPIVTDLRALASPLEVESAQLQISGDDRGSTPPWSQTVTLVGGDDVAYRELGTVESGSGTVGKSVYAGDWGVLSQVASDPGTKCRGAIDGNDRPQALWVFSHDACGTYGFDAVIQQAGRSSEGRIVLVSTRGDLNVRSGSAMLLRINGGRDHISQNEMVSK
jgi:hypothetical protein